MFRWILHPKREWQVMMWRLDLSDKELCVSDWLAAVADRWWE